ncbi:hypothetical protein PHYSODRAFT_253909 [Phytophthora sojae]|uniref:Sulfatase N-terminal domain-containing protein n=1 Tax=Phytophthora sojae (strain P6497) TaxID=1094619 RepID=G5AAJ7_PHYSP|nr:hypothetical protein PHYSODRAFT_253909 [Phytophthora sojae]EGZ07626.1 hypothetical protein PHYSODRAFT_253909 [Phytophthora sojae]|eukprot:XP_009537192.1 hypothetical protein PHYSODRAFT_253909 [Phytophthora sojae]
MHHDSLYRRTTGFHGDLAFNINVSDDDPPNWAKRGVAFTNYWSSWRTSRSVESLQFAQLPYDDVEDSGMTGGKKDVELAGLPQLFKAKGYESFFTTGCQTEYDDWNSFLPAHGFDTVWSRDEMMKIAESDLNISSDDWYGEQQ